MVFLHCSSQGVRLSSDVCYIEKSCFRNQYRPENGHTISSSLDSVAVINIMTQNNLGKKSAYFMKQVLNHGRGKQEQAFGGRNRKSNHEEVLFTLFQFPPTQNLVHAVGWILPCQTLINIMIHRPTGWGRFLTRSFSDANWDCHIYKEEAAQPSVPLPYILPSVSP